MISKTTELLYAEAARKLDAYLATGIEGFRQQAWDRLVAAGANLYGMDEGRKGAEMLRHHLRLMGI